jgi:hypothetical protein
MLRNMKKSGLMFMSFLGMAALLPVLMIGVLNPEGIKTIIKADQPPDLRIWFEPAEVITHPGLKFQVKVMAEYDSKTGFVPKVEGNIKSDVKINISPEKVSYEVPFSGTVVLGTYQVSSSAVGKYVLEIPPAGVFTQAPNLNVLTSGAVVYSRP